MTVVAGFWGLTVEPESVYNQLVELNFRLTNVALDAKAPVSGGRVSLMVKIGHNEFVLANLIPGKIEQQTIDITFCEGEDVTFSVTGDATVHLSGNYIIDSMDDEPSSDYDEDEELDDIDDDDEDDDDEDDEGEDMEDIFFNEDGDPVDAEGNLIDMSDDDEEDEDDDDDEEDDEEEMDEEELMAMLGAKKRTSSSSTQGKSKKAKIEEVTDEEAELVISGKAITSEKKKSDKVEKKVEVEEKTAKGGEVKNQQKKMKGEVKEQQQQQKQQQQSTKSSEPQQPPKKDKSQQQTSEESPKKKTLPSGLIIEDITQGTGPRANNGKRVSVRYIGKLMNGKVFDSNTSGGKPFGFKLGAGQVIKGWDMGVQGMQVGGTRKLTIPAKLAYGSSGAPPDIPPNSTLMFEVKLLEVK